jgi:hypothetical protein
VAIAHLGDNVGVRMSVGGLEQHEFQAQSGQAPPAHEPQSGAFNIDSKARLATGLEVTLEASSATAQQNTTLMNAFVASTVYHTSSFKAGILVDTNWGRSPSMLTATGWASSRQSARSAC